MTESDPVLSAAEDIASGVVAAQAPETDSRGAFPERSISALAEAGLLGVLSDRSVCEIAQHRPTDLAGLRAVHGIGPAKLEALRDLVVVS